jgi:hypothetical protein
MCSSLVLSLFSLSNADTNYVLTATVDGFSHIPAYLGLKITFRSLVGHFRFSKGTFRPGCTSPPIVVNFGSSPHEVHADDADSFEYFPVAQAVQVG